MPAGRYQLARRQGSEGYHPKHGTTSCRFVLSGAHENHHRRSCTSRLAQSLIAAAPKPSGGIGAPKTWRSIALCESAWKALRKLSVLGWSSFPAPQFRQAQGGPRQGSSLDYPLALSKNHVRMPRQQRCSRAIIFIDGVAAFYAVMRQYLYDNRVVEVAGAVTLELVHALPRDAHKSSRLNLLPSAFKVVVGTQHIHITIYRQALFRFFHQARY